MKNGSTVPEEETRTGLYVHWPFCQAKCPYCDFNSHVRHRPVDQDAFAAALVRELEHVAATSDRARITSVFFGGGTPSLMEARTVGTVMEGIARLCDLDGEAEVTLEANPTSAEASRFRGYRAAGVGRLSLGVQSLRDDELRFLGRLHSAAEARAAIALARETFPRLSFDMIYARPGQTAAEWARELEEAIGLAADHLSLYQLTIEDGTPFQRLHRAGKLPVPDDDRAADLYELTQEITAEHGLPAYEVSNHARCGAASRHNLTYWRYRPYLAVGPGAHGRIMRNGRRVATRAEANPERWLSLVEDRSHGWVEETVLRPAEQADEMLVMGLRLVEGLDLTRLERLGGREPDPSILRDLEADGLLERAGTRIRPTPGGMLVVNALVEAMSGAMTGPQP